MRNYHCKVLLEAPAAAVYDALTSAVGLQSWWTATCDVGKRPGAESTFRFGETFNVMRIEKLEPVGEVHWRCVKQYHHAPGQLARVDEWTGTSLIFKIQSQTPGRTILEFEHHGLQPHLECYKICEAGWDHFLKRSLKSYLETGLGEPFLVK